MKNVNYYAIMPVNELRSRIMECGVIIEDIATLAIGHIMKIEPKGSKVIGHTSSSISFNHKILFISEIKGLPKDIKHKLQVFMEIRNKFAHVKSVDSFKSLFAIEEVRKQKHQKKLETWYKDQGEKEDTFEDQFRHYFALLTDEICEYLRNQVFQHIYESVSEQTRNDLNAEFIKILKEDVKKSVEANEIWNKAVEKVSKKNKENVA